VNLKGSNDFVVRDITDINHPSTVSSLGNQVAYSAQFVSATELSDALGTQGLFRMTLNGSQRTLVAACGTQLFAWSPDGTDAAYLSGSQDPQVEQLHIVSRGRDSVVDSIRTPIVGGFGCENRTSCESWSFRLMYSPTGAYISLVQSPGTGLRIWTSDGKLLKTVDSSPATMPVWSGNSFYWRDEKGVEMWRDGAQSSVLPGVSWLNPHASPAGGAIVYHVRDADHTTAHVFLLDIATGKTREIAQSHSYPSFLTSRYLWFLGERPCAASEQCMDPTVESGIAYIYDLQTAAQSQSIITRVYDVWPHPA
jgi:Tol biopolymer transport system component